MILFFFRLTGRSHFFYGKHSMTNRSKKKKKEIPKEHQLTISEDFEQEIFFLANPWMRSCQKIKRVLEDFFKNS
ncbi:MAG: hypothetical protein ACOYK9_05630 [Chlamydiia bacterium]